MHLAQNSSTLFNLPAFSTLRLLSSLAQLWKLPCPGKAAVPRCTKTEGSGCLTQLRLVPAGAMHGSGQLAYSLSAQATQLFITPVKSRPSPNWGGCPRWLRAMPRHKFIGRECANTSSTSNRKLSEIRGLHKGEKKTDCF